MNFWYLLKSWFSPELFAYWILEIQCNKLLKKNGIRLSMSNLFLIPTNHKTNLQVLRLGSQHLISNKYNLYTLYIPLGVRLSAFNTNCLTTAQPRNPRYKLTIFFWADKLFLSGEKYHSMTRSYSMLRWLHFSSSDVFGIRKSTACFVRRI